MVLTTGTVSFRCNYRINGRQETLALGRYGAGGMSLLEVRKKLDDAKKELTAGKSPARQKARQRQQVKDSDSFGESGPSSGWKSTGWQTRRGTCAARRMNET